jgi:arginase family enzyme
MPYSGIPTFFRTDFAEDWEKVDIGLIGVATDAGLSHRSGAHYGAQAVRANPD